MHVRKCHKETQYFYINLIFNAKIKNQDTLYTCLKS